MSALKPPSGPSAAQRAQAAQAAKAERDRVAREAQAAQAAKDRAARAAQAERDRIAREAQARAEEDNRSIFDQLENIQLVSKDRPELEFAGADGPEPSELRAPSRPVVPSNLTFGAEPTAVSAVSPLSFCSGTTTKAAGSAPAKTGITSGLDPNAE